MVNRPEHYFFFRTSLSFVFINQNVKDWNNKVEELKLKTYTDLQGTEFYTGLVKFVCYIFNSFFNTLSNLQKVSLILFLEIVHFHNFHWKEEASVCLWIKGQHYEKGIPFIRNSPFFDMSIYRFYKSRNSNYQLRSQSWIWLR